MQNLADRAWIEGDDLAWRGRVERALAAIDKRHELPASIGGVTIVLVPQAELGEFCGKPVLGTYYCGFIQLGIDAPEWVIIHELAHWLNDAWAHVRGTDDIEWLHDSGEADEWWDAVYNSELMHRVWGSCSVHSRAAACRDTVALQVLDYWVRGREQWARSYTQWVLASSDDLREQIPWYSKLVEQRQLGPIAHWPLEDAERFATAFEQVIDRMNAASTFEVVVVPEAA